MTTATSITAKPARPAVYLYNCKRCKTGRRVEYPHRDPRGGSYRLEEAGQRIAAGAWLVFRGFGQAKPVSFGFTVQRGDTWSQYDGDPLAICDGCRSLMAYGRVQGIFNPAVRCDARCTNARGHNCECSCGGENHGAGWGAAYREAA